MTVNNINKEIPLTGPEALAHALSKINLDGLKQKHMDIIRSGAKSKRTKSIQALNAIEGLQRNDLTPDKLLISNVPVIPPAFRPFSVLGTTFVPGDANELYRDLFQYRDAHDESVELLGQKGSSQAKLDLFDTVKALYGYSDPIAPKTKQRGVSGFLKTITGVGPKWSWLQRKLISKPQDSVARGTIAVNPDLSLDEIGVPLDMAWVMYAPYIQRRLVQHGMSSVSALENIKNRTDYARNALNREVEERPVIYSRAPSWHKFNVLSGRPKLIEGNTIAINPLVTTGLNADFDGDCSKSQILACIPLEAVELWRMDIPHIDKHEVNLNNNIGANSIPCIQGGKLYLFDLEDFPHGELIHSKEGKNGRIDLHNIPHPIQVLSYNEEKSNLIWADVACWSKHYHRVIEIVDTHNGYQIITDDDPRAVYGTAAGSLNMERFTPSAALVNKVLVPRARYTPSYEVLFTEIPGGRAVINKGYSMKDNIPLNAATGWLLGAVCGDGWAYKDKGEPVKMGFADNDGFNVNKLNTILPSLFTNNSGPVPYTVVGKAEDEGRYGDTVSYRYSSSALAHWIRDLLGGERDETTAGSANKHLPVFYLSAPEEFKLGLFAGLMDTDGSISVSNGKSKPQLMSNFGSTSLRLCQEVKLLAASLNIFGRITATKTPRGKDCWIVSFSNKDIQKWGGKYMAHVNKLKALNSVPVINDSPVTAKYDIIPISARCADAIAKAVGCPKITKEQRLTADAAWLEGRKETQALYMTFAQTRNKEHDKYGAISRSQALQAIKLLGREKINSLPDGALWLQIVDAEDITWERVTGIQKTGVVEDGYDLTVPGYETFMSADGIILSNTMNLHVPSQPDAVKEAWEKLMPSKMLFSIKDPEAVVPVPKQELILGLYTANRRDAKNKHTFNSEEEALKAIKTGAVKLSDDIEIMSNNPVPLTTAPIGNKDMVATTV